jgi:hypothetical protein
VLGHLHRGTAARGGSRERLMGLGSGAGARGSVSRGRLARSDNGWLVQVMNSGAIYKINVATLSWL